MKKSDKENYVFKILTKDEKVKRTKEIFEVIDEYL